MLIAGSYPQGRTTVLTLLPQPAIFIYIGVRSMGEEVNPQKENGHVDIANEIVEALYRLQLSGNQWRVLWVILRQTWGWHIKMETITISYFAKRTGLKRSHIARALKELSDRKVVTKIGNSSSVSYGFNKHYNQWMLLPKLVLLPKLDKPVTKIGRELLPKKDGLLKETIIKETNNKETIYIPVFEYWNSKEIIVHRKLTEKIKVKIKAALKDH